MDADAAVIWSVLWNGRMAENQKVYEHYRQTNRPVIIMDIGALYRGHTWKISVNNINATGYYGHQQDLDLDRPKKLSLSLGYTLVGNSSILIAAQHNRSLQVANLASIEDWVTEQVRLVKQHTDRPIVIRPHPRCRFNLTQLPNNVSFENPAKVAGTYDNFDLRFDYHALINYNSGPGIQGAIEGCPVIVDGTSLASPVSITYKELETRPLIDREQWFIEITHTEYTIEEIKKGTWLKRISTAL